jgi:hypothetical protein
MRSTLRSSQVCVSYRSTSQITTRTASAITLTCKPTFLWGSVFYAGALTACSHAVTGPGGGAPALFAEQGETKIGHFRLLDPGLFLYVWSRNRNIAMRTDDKCVAPQVTTVLPVLWPCTSRVECTG